MKTHTQRYLTMLITTSLILTGCGGGGGNSSSTSTTSQTTPTTSTPTGNGTTNIGSTSPTTPAVSTTNTTAENNVIAILNQKRTQCGLSALTANNELNKVAGNHANYLNYVSAQNKSNYASHVEEVTMIDGVMMKFTDPSTNPYFSGVTIGDRAKTQANLGKEAQPVSYNYSLLEENLAVDSLESTGGQPSEDVMSQKGLNSLLSAPYHMQGLLNPIPTDIGVKNLQTNWLVNGGYAHYLNTLEIVSGLPLTSTIPNNTKLINYPCNGITNTEYALTNEIPNPVPSRNLATNPVGQPIYILAPSGKTINTVDVHISNNSIEISDPIILTSVTDPNNRLSNNEAIIIPNKPLNPAATYAVTYTLHYSDGSTDSRSFTFITKSQSL